MLCAGSSALLEHQKWLQESRDELLGTKSEVRTRYSLTNTNTNTNTKTNASTNTNIAVHTIRLRF